MVRSSRIPSPATRSVSGLWSLGATALCGALAGAPCVFASAAFVELCQDAALPEAQAYTVRVILQDALDRESAAPPERTPEHCAQADRALQGRTGFQLLHKDIVDLTPFGTIDGLETLYLSYNRIENVYPLARLKTLRVLDLEGNQVKDASALKSLPALQELVLAGNPLEQPAPRPAAAPSPPPPPRVESRRAVEYVPYPVYYDAYRYPYCYDCWYERDHHDAFWWGVGTGYVIGAPFGWRHHRHWH